MAHDLKGQLSELENSLGNTLSQKVISSYFWSYVWRVAMCINVMSLLLINTTWCFKQYKLIIYVSGDDKSNMALSGLKSRYDRTVFFSEGPRQDFSGFYKFPHSLV